MTPLESSKGKRSTEKSRPAIGDRKHSTNTRRQTTVSGKWEFSIHTRPTTGGGKQSKNILYCTVHYTNLQEVEKKLHKYCISKVIKRGGKHCTKTLAEQFQEAEIQREYKQNNYGRRKTHHEYMQKNYRRRKKQQEYKKNNFRRRKTQY